MGSRYETVRVLGHGGMSTVYLAHDVVLGRDVALKVLASNLADDVACRTRFLREAKAAARVSHPNVVRIYGVGEDDRGPFIAMEHVSGPTLAEEVGRRGALPPADAVTIGTQLSAALAEAHTAGVIHRDVTPRNVLLDVDGTPKLTDFGIARLLDGTRLTEHGTIMGTAAYLAPEQARGDPVTPAADVYSLGAVLYELLSGGPPFEADTLPALLLRREHGAAVPLRERAPAVPPALEKTVMRALEHAPDKRPSAAALGSALAASLNGETRRTQVLTSAAATQVLRRAPRSGRRAILAAAAVCAAALLAAGIVRFADGGTAAVSPPPPVAPGDVVSPPAVAPPPAPVPVAPTPPPTSSDERGDSWRAGDHGKGKKKGHEKHGRHAKDG
jgi:eukaryotic-like serine/threonine-protein kinase